MNFSSPLTLLIRILTQVIILCLLIWITINSSWYAFILFLIYLGGLIVLFVYITRIASNEKLTTNFSLLNCLIIIISLIIFFSWIIGNERDLSFLKFNPILNLNFIFNLSNLKFSIYSMVYLLFSLIVVIKVCNKLNAPIKSSYNK